MVRNGTEADLLRCVYACMYGGMYVCADACIWNRKLHEEDVWFARARRPTCSGVCMHVCMRACMPARVRVCMNPSMYVCVCIHACMFVCTRASQVY